MTVRMWLAAVGLSLVVAGAVGNLTACIEPRTTPCGDGYCGVDATCLKSDKPETPERCELQVDVSACENKSQGDECDLRGTQIGRCRWGACTNTFCGDGITDANEACDDGNARSGDGCSQDCLSDETCGNGYVDTIKGEECDNRPAGLSRDGCSSTCFVESTVAEAIVPTLLSNPQAAVDAANNDLYVIIENTLWRYVYATGAFAQVSNTKLLGDVLALVVSYASGERRIEALTRLGTATLYWRMQAQIWSQIGEATGVDVTIAAGDRSTGQFFGIRRQIAGAAVDFYVWNVGAGWQALNRPAQGCSTSPNSYMIDTNEAGVAVLIMCGTVQELTLTDAARLVTTPYPNYAGTPPTSIFLVPNSSRLGIMTPAGPYAPGSATWSPLMTPPVGKLVYGPENYLLTTTGSLVAANAYNGIASLAVGGPPALTFSTATGAKLCPDLNANRGFGIVRDGQYLAVDVIDGAFRQVAASRHADLPRPGAFRNFVVGCGATTIYVVGWPTAGSPAEVWAWDINAEVWTLLATQNSPSERTDASLVWDETAGQLVLFGGAGVGAASPTVTLSPAANASWTNVTEGPTSRRGASFVWDRRQQAGFLFGGRTAANYFDETWMWKANRWWQLCDKPLANNETCDATHVRLRAHPPARYNHHAYFDRNRGAVVVSAGLDETSQRVDTWVLNIDEQRWEPSPIQFPAGAEVGFVNRGVFAKMPDRAVLYRVVSDYAAAEACDDTDRDGDNLIGCADPDCWSIFTPSCAPREACTRQACP